MSLGEKLKSYKGERQQKEVAAEWLERWAKTGRKELSLGTVEPRLSQCMNDVLDGIEFFFQERLRGSLLLEALNVPADARDALLREAEEQIRRGGTPQPRLVVDVSSLLQKASPNVEGVREFFRAVQEQLIDGPLKPVVLIVTRAQHEVMPRTIADQAHDYWVEVVQDEKEARARLAELSADGQAIVSGMLAERAAVLDLSRWIAADYEVARKRFAFEPPDGLALYAAEGRLPTPQVPEHPLSDGFIEDAAQDEGQREAPDVLPPEYLDSACATRRLAYALVDEAKVEEMPPQEAAQAFRRAAARVLGVTATSTSAERLDAALSNLDIEVSQSNEAELDKLLERARRRPVEPTAVDVGGVVHLINYGDVLPLEVRSNKTARVHNIECRRPAISALKETVSAYSPTEAAQDRYLVRAMAKVDPSGEAAEDLEHARWCLTVSGAAEAKAAQPVGWREALSKIVASDPPVAFLALPRGSRDLFYVEPDHDDGLVIPIAPLMLRPGDSYLELTMEPHEHSGYWGHSDDADARTPEAFIDPRSYEDAEAWLDLREYEVSSRWPAGAKRPDAPTQWKVKKTSRQVPAELWEDATTRVAVLWMALRRAIAATAIDAQRKAGLLHLGGGVIAIVSAVQDSAAAETTAVLPLTHDRERPYDPPFLPMKQVEIGHASGWKLGPTTIGPFLPETVTLAGGGAQVVISFTGSPFFGDVGDQIRAAAIGHARRRAQQDEEEQQYDDD